MSTAGKLGPVPQIINLIPRNGITPEIIHDYLLAILKGITSESEYEAVHTRFLKAIHGEPTDTALPLVAFAKLDELILYQAETLGWRIALSPIVTWRFSNWEIEHPEGLELLESYGKAILLSARYWRRMERAPFNDPGLYQFKRETVKELGRVLAKMRDALNISRKEMSDGEVWRLFKETVSSESHLSHLNLHLDLWLDFFQSISLRSFVLGRVTHQAKLFDEWVAWRVDLDQEYVRQKTSRLSKAWSRK